MIEKTQSYKTSDGAVHPTLKSAQMVEILFRLREKEPSLSGDGLTVGIEAIVGVLVEHAAEFALILGQKPRKPRARKPKATKPAKPSAKSSETPKP